MTNEGIDVTDEGASSETWRRGLASIGALLSAILLIALVVLVANSNRDRDVAAARERRSYEIMNVTRQVDASIARAEAALGRYVISGDRGTGTLYFDEWKNAGRALDHLGKITRENPTQLALVRRLETLYAQRGRELAEPATLTNFRQGMRGVSLFYQAGKSRSIFDLAKALREISANERNILAQRSAVSERSAARSNSLAALLSAIGVLLVLGAAFLGWTTIQATRLGRAARREAQEESQRAGSLEQAVADRTRELSDAYERLREESSTRAAAEAQLRQVQKMEAVGQLTGGIAHDFNNMLAVVVGGLDLARRRLQHETDEVGRHIDNAMEGANRAAALTKRLLAFARAEPLLPEGVDPAARIAGMSDLLDRTLGERIRVETRGPPGGWRVWCDPHQLENAILNLAVNARDAMDGEGTLAITTANIVLGDGEVGEARAGEYVRISVTDTGCGMTEEVMERAFEPFFTTKPVGKGTGLGLSQIFGFAHQSEGEIAITSRPGHGSTVSLYLPRLVSDAPGIFRVDEEQILAPSATAAILVVEDDARVRSSTIAALEELGHRPVGCASGEEALSVIDAHPDIRLVITDVVMPVMTGPQLIAALLPARSHLGVLYVTGYVGEAGDAAQFSGHDVLRKPFTVSALERAVAAALTRSRTPTGPRRVA